MNYKIVLGIVGVFIVIGGIIYFASRDNSEKTSEPKSNRKNDEKKSTDIVERENTSEDKEATNLNDVKSNAAEKMSERHEEAKKIMKESVDSIFGEAEVGETKNKEAKNKMFENLDNI